MAIDLTLAIATTTAAIRTNTTISKPTSSTTDDILIGVLYIEADVAVTAPSASWTLIDSVDHTGQAMDVYAWWYRVVSGDSGVSDWTWTHASAYSQGMLYRISGCETSGSPLDGTATTNQGTSTTITNLAVTTGQDNSALVSAAGWWEAGKTTSGHTSPLTERNQLTQIGMSSGIQAAAGSSGNKTITISAAGTDEWVSIFFALKEPGAAATTMPPRPVIVRQAVKRASSW